MAYRHDTPFESLYGIGSTDLSWCLPLVAKATVRSLVGCCRLAAMATPRATPASPPVSQPVIS